MALGGAAACGAKELCTVWTQCEGKTRCAHEVGFPWARISSPEPHEAIQARDMMTVWSKQKQAEMYMIDM